MYKVSFTSGAQRFGEKIVEGSTKVCDYLNEHGGCVGTLMFNGSVISNGHEEKSFEELANFYGVEEGGTILLFDAPKTANARWPH